MNSVTHDSPRFLRKASFGPVVEFFTASSLRNRFGGFLAIVIIQFFFVGYSFAQQNRVNPPQRSKPTIEIIHSGLTIHITSKRQMLVSIAISNIIGVPVVEFRRFFLEKGRNRINLRRFNLAHGIYILTLNGDNIQIVQRIIVGS